jgi:hypothetical protein
MRQAVVASVNQRAHISETGNFDHRIFATGS